MCGSGVRLRWVAVWEDLREEREARLEMEKWQEICIQILKWTLLSVGSVYVW